MLKDSLDNIVKRNNIDSIKDECVGCEKVFVGRSKVYENVRKIKNLQFENLH